MTETNVTGIRGDYIPAVLEEYFLNGDSYITMSDAYAVCTERNRSYAEFVVDLAEQLRRGNVAQEGERLYLAKTLRYENYAAIRLADIVRDNSMARPPFTTDLTRSGDIRLCAQQCAAVIMALSNRLSIVLGGAGTGKSTLIRKILEERPDGEYVLAAPTGKAARNLQERTGFRARTMHSALEIFPNEDALKPVVWEWVSLVVIDEASMVTLEMMAALLSKVRHDCRIVLVGDPEQLGSVGSGDVLNDCLGLGFPCIRLKQNFRQTDKNAELFRNVDGFISIRSEDQLGYDDSFRRAEPDERAVVEEALRHKQVQVISPFNNAVDRLNTELRGRFNPAAPEKREIWSRERVFRDGDRVLITKNNGALGCVNGDVGIFRIDDDDVFEPVYHVELDGNRCPQWWGYEGLENMTLAYAITVHRSQGSQYDVVLFYVPEEKSNLQRNLLYTAISRAKKQEILYCSRQTLDAAIRTPPRRRNSMLMDKAMAAFLELVA